MANLHQYEKNTYRLAEWLEDLTGVINTCPMGRRRGMRSDLIEVREKGLTELAERVRPLGMAGEEPRG